ncbi:MAG TPA: kelch repeat-containing protein [Terriglobales bacterium]|nr:kelch repeat-containing protein [Terriglobales bacterium]
MQQVHRSVRLLSVTAFLIALCVPSAFTQDRFASPALRWLQVNTAQSPSARSAPAMAYDPVSKKIVMFGGWDGTKYPTDTWTFDGSHWQQVKTAVSPAGRAGATMAYDAPSRKLVMFGGFDGNNYRGDTWVWDGVSMRWVQAHPTQLPTAVTGPQLFGDPKNGHADLFGGYAPPFYRTQMFQWTGSDWLALNPPTTPTARSGAVVGLNPAIHQVVLFSGLSELNVYNTWTWDGTNWTEESPSSQPPSRYDAAGAYEPHLGGVVAFGGGEGGVDMSDSWEWNGSDWVLLQPLQSPPPRESFGMAYDFALHHVVIFGGQFGNSLLNDTWVLAPAP